MADYELIGSGYQNTADIPKDKGILYHCSDCRSMIPSIPDDNIGCECGNIFIDKDCWRLVVVDFNNLEVIRRGSSECHPEL